MSSVGYGFALPCLQLLSVFTRRRVAAAILVAAAVVFLINGYRWTNDKRVFGDDRQQAPLRAQSGYLGRTADNICVYPNFVLSGEGSPKAASRFLLEPDYEEFDRDDPTARARVGPSPQLSGGDANYTVIYNFASPTPRRKEADKDDGGYAGEQELEEEDDDDADDDSDEESLVTAVDEDHLTLATHASPANLHRVTELLSHWNAEEGAGHPVSVAVYAPGEDFCVASAVISWLWTCDKSVRRHVSFHIVFPADSASDIASKTAGDGIRILDNVDCTKNPRDSLLDSASFRVRHRLPYPANVARNVARSAAESEYVLGSDVALLPSRGFADKFINFVKSSEGQKLKEGKRPLAFVVPAFDLAEGRDFPLSKAVLADAVAASKAEHLDKLACPHCHKFAGLKKWLKLEEGGGDRLSVFATTNSRHFPHSRWEPVLIGRGQELPLLDERLFLEGARDRSAHMLELCLIGFRFTVLDSLFLIRRGGVRRREKVDPRNARFLSKNKRTLAKITGELRRKHGSANRRACKDVVVV